MALPSSATGSIRMRPLPMSARHSSMSSSAARRTRSCRCGASCFPSACMSCARSHCCGPTTATSSGPILAGRRRATASSTSTTRSWRAGSPRSPSPSRTKFHAQPVKGVSRVREIRDFPDGGHFTSSFPINDPDLPGCSPVFRQASGTRSSRSSTPWVRPTRRSTSACRRWCSTRTCTWTTW